MQDADKITQVSHLYSDGDICHETNELRQVEVKMRCNDNVNGIRLIDASLSIDQHRRALSPSS